MRESLFKTTTTGEIRAKDTEKSGEIGAKFSTPAGVISCLLTTYPFVPLPYPFFYPFYPYSKSHVSPVRRIIYAKKEGLRLQSDDGIPKGPLPSN